MYRTLARTGGALARRSAAETSPSGAAFSTVAVSSSEARASASNGSVRALSSAAKIPAPPMVYIAGEEMTHYCMQLVLEKWVNPHLDTSSWENFDLSCKVRGGAAGAGVARARVVRRRRGGSPARWCCGARASGTTPRPRPAVVVPLGASARGGQTACAPSIQPRGPP